MIYENKVKLDLVGMLKGEPAAIDGFMFWLVNKIPSFGNHTITGPDGSPYLLRVYLTPKRFFGAWWPGVFLHRFFRSDHDRIPHNHPWCFSVSFILTNGYTENRWDPDAKDFRQIKRRPFSFNVIRANDFHRVDLDNKEFGCWTLFFAFQHAQDWGFLDLDTLKVIPWKKYLGIDADGLSGD